MQAAFLLVELLLLGSLPFCSVGVEHHMLEAWIVLAKLKMPCKMLCILHCSHFQQMTAHTSGTHICNVLQRWTGLV